MKRRKINCEMKRSHHSSGGVTPTQRYVGWPTNVRVFVTHGILERPSRHQRLFGRNDIDVDGFDHHGVHVVEGCLAAPAECAHHPPWSPHSSRFSDPTGESLFAHPLATNATLG